ncbi:hypothetical protein DFJ63DRAFT_314169 [Scheffersomyces coipomensis]|uniref:uncharacterized protein n=1 Tax=Scheffersomyces coipomensis TaxID=1788519 RepID=UPI00315DE77B
MSEEVPESQPEQQPVDVTKKVPETEEERAERLAKQEEVDGRSVYVGNVDYQSTPEQLEEFFHVVGVIERVTILFDRYSGLPKGYAYVEFENVESVEKAIEDLHGKTFRGRELRVTAKRTNLPGFRKNSNGFRGGRGGPRGGARGTFRGGRGPRGSFRGRGRGRGGYRGSSSGEIDGEAVGSSEAETTGGEGESAE